MQQAVPGYTEPGRRSYLVSILFPLALVILNLFLFVFSIKAIRVPFTPFSISIYLVYAVCTIIIAGIIVVQVSLNLHFMRGQNAAALLIIAVYLICISTCMILFLSHQCIAYGAYETRIDLPVRARVRLLELPSTSVRLTRNPGTCLYFSAITWTTVGFGDVIPTRGLRPATAIVALGQSFVIGLLISFLIDLRKVEGAASP